MESPEGDGSENEPILYDERDDSSVGATRTYNASEPIIIIDGQAYEYDPNDLENNPILDNLTPLGGVTPNSEVDSTPRPPTESDITPETPDTPGNVENQPAERDSGGTVTYPPAGQRRCP